MDDLVTIGRFSTMTRLSVKALRIYDDMGLLRPAWVDPSSGYRYYRLGQANHAEAIRILRAIEMPLDEIREVLAHDDAALVHKALDRHRARLQERLAEQERMLAFLERLIERQEGVMPYEVEIKDTLEQPVVAVRRTTSLTRIADDVAAGFGAVMGYLGSRGVAPSGAPLIIYHDVIDEHTDGDVEICVPVAQPGDGDGDVYGTVLEGGTVAATVHRGPYHEIGPAYHTLQGWIAEQGHAMAGPPREAYLNDPRDVSPDDLLTELSWPIRQPPDPSIPDPALPGGSSV